MGADERRPGFDRERLERAGLAGLVATVRSVGRLRKIERYKPSRPEVYELLPEEATLVSGHAWDVIGARAAGRDAVWVNRDGERVAVCRTSGPRAEEARDLVVAAGAALTTQGRHRPLDLDVRQPVEPARQVPAAPVEQGELLGRTIERMIVASSSSATATPKPICWNITSWPAAKPAKTTMMISAAPVMIRAVEETPVATASRVEPLSS